MKNLKLEHLQNSLDYFAEENPELKKVFLHAADIRCGKRVALAIRGERGTISVKTRFFSYAEMDAFLVGYSTKKRGLK